MYNGIGLQTARGSGTSGYVQKNVSYNVKKIQTKEEFLKKLDDARKNNMPTARKANPQIIEHERKREIYIQKERLRAKLQGQGVSEEQITQRLEKAQKIIREKLQKGELQTKNKDTHIMTEAKQREYVKLSQAFGLKENTKHGSAFDFEGQNEERMKHLQEKRKRTTFKCHQEGCQKSYDSQQRLDRHLKYKHPQSIKEQSNVKAETTKNN